MAARRRRPATSRCEATSPATRCGKAHCAHARTTCLATSRSLTCQPAARPATRPSHVCPANAAKASSRRPHSARSRRIATAWPPAPAGSCAATPGRPASSSTRSTRRAASSANHNPARSASRRSSAQRARLSSPPAWGRALATSPSLLSTSGWRCCASARTSSLCTPSTWRTAALARLCTRVRASSRCLAASAAASRAPSRRCFPPRWRCWPPSPSASPPRQRSPSTRRAGGCS
mmetsp:Transcript_18411/g.60047  ORF Transcript_18411/g.60047 Transcript_18411/m.60047 type:complete len:234 (+) Transcript_18411:470-1171(+)